MMGRRQLLAMGLTACTAPVVMAGRARAAGTAAPPNGPDPDDTVPETLGEIATAGGAQTPGFPVGHLGVTWSGGGRGGAVRFRGRDGWGAWQPLPLGDSPGAGRGAALVPAGGALGYEVSPPPGVGAVATVAINTTDGPRVRRPQGPQPEELPLSAGGRGRVRYRSRAGWGADESLRFGPGGAELFPTAFFPVETLTVHHTVTANNDPDPAATVRAIYFFHTITQDFGDIGYHLLVDSDGTVYEGRWSGPDPVPVFDDGRSVDGRPRMSNGAHVGGFNAGNVGVALLGDLTAAQPTAAARRTLIDVLAGLCGLTRMDPLAQVSYVNPISGSLAEVDAIAGHRDWLATECPGNAFHPTLPGVRSEVAALLERRPSGGGVL